MKQSSPTQMPPQPPSLYPPRRQGAWRTVLVGMALGLTAGILLTLGIVSLLAANGAMQISSPVVSSGATVNSSPHPTTAPTSTPNPTATRLPTATPPLTPTHTATPGASSSQLFGPDDPRVYLLAIFIFIFLAVILIARMK